MNATGRAASDPEAVDVLQPYVPRMVRYWDVETEDARNLTLYQDLVTGEWYEQRYGES